MSFHDLDVNVIGEITKYLHPIYRKRLKITCTNLCEKIDMIEELQKEEKVKYSGQEMMHIGLREKDIELCRKGIQRGVKMDDLQILIIQLSWSHYFDGDKETFEKFKAMMEREIEMNFIMNVNDGMTLKHVNRQTEDICVAAVKQNGKAIYYVREQTERICREAVKQDGTALVYVKKQTSDICMEAFKQNKEAIKWVKDIDVMRYIIIEDWRMIRSIPKSKMTNDILIMVVRSIVRIPIE